MSKSRKASSPVINMSSRHTSAKTSSTARLNQDLLLHGLMYVDEAPGNNSQLFTPLAPACTAEVSLMAANMVAKQKEELKRKDLTTPNVIFSPAPSPSSTPYDEDESVTTTHAEDISLRSGATLVVHDLLKLQPEELSSDELKAIYEWSLRALERRSSVELVGSSKTVQLSKISPYVHHGSINVRSFQPPTQPNVSKRPSTPLKTAISSSQPRSTSVASNSTGTKNASKSSISRASQQHRNTSPRVDVSSQKSDASISSISGSEDSGIRTKTKHKRSMSGDGRMRLQQRQLRELQELHALQNIRKTSAHNLQRPATPRRHANTHKTGTATSERVQARKDTSSTPAGSGGHYEDDPELHYVFSQTNHPSPQHAVASSLQSRPRSASQSRPPTASPFHAGNSVVNLGHAGRQSGSYSFERLGAAPPHEKMFEMYPQFNSSPPIITESSLKSALHSQLPEFVQSATMAPEKSAARSTSSHIHPHADTLQIHLPLPLVDDDPIAPAFGFGLSTSPRSAFDDISISSSGSGSARSTGGASILSSRSLDAPPGDNSNDRVRARHRSTISNSQSALLRSSQSTGSLTLTGNHTGSKAPLMRSSDEERL